MSILTGGDHDAPGDRNLEDESK